MATPDRTPRTPPDEHATTPLQTVLAAHQTLAKLREDGRSWREIADAVNATLATTGCAPMTAHAVRQLVEGSRRARPRVARPTPPDVLERSRLEKLGQQRVCE